MHEFDSFLFDPASPPPPAPYSQPCLHLISSLRTSTQPELRGEDKLTSFLRERVFSKNVSLHASVPLSKRLTFAKEPGMKKHREEPTATAAEMERRAVINLVEVSQFVDLPQLLEHRVVEECMALFNSNGMYKKTQKSKLTQKLSLSLSLSLCNM